MTGNNFIFDATNGTPGWSCYVLTSTNVLSSLNSWTVISTNTFDAAGQFSCTNIIRPGTPQAFYALELGTLPPAAALPGTIALFKTPTVRDLVSSEPYLHTGRMDTIEDMLQFYQNFSALARAGAVRNADPQLSNISLDSSAVAPLAAFLRALDEEDYADIPCPCQ
jgi:cytochrome c peroxidase